MTTRGHHTTEDRGDPDFVEDNGPFRSAGSLAFLGVGYYFWEESIELAHWWGKSHCSAEYIICEGTIECPDKVFLDLLGRMTDIKYLKEVKQTLAGELQRSFGTVDVPLGVLIEFLKRVETVANRKGVFPFKVIRAIDSSARVQEAMKFVGSKPNFINLSPRVIICLIERNKLFLPDFKIIFPEKYVT